MRDVDNEVCRQIISSYKPFWATEKWTNC